MRPLSGSMSIIRPGMPIFNNFQMLTVHQILDQPGPKSPRAQSLKKDSNSYLAQLHAESPFAPNRPIASPPHARQMAKLGVDGDTMPVDTDNVARFRRNGVY